MPNSGDEDPAPAAASSGRSVAWLKRSWFLLLGSALFIVVIVWVYCATTDPKIGHDSALDAVFDSRLMIAGSRVVVGAGIAYLLLSILVRVKRGQWVRNAGPFQTDDRPEQKIADSQSDLLIQLREAKRTIADLRDRLARSIQSERDLLAILDSRLGDRQGGNAESHDD